MASVWIVVADKARARILFAQHSKEELQDIEQLVYPEAGLKAQAFASDRSGRSFDSAGQARHTMGHKVEPKEQEAIHFAKLIAEYLEKGRQEDRYRKLILIAAPHFLGLLRKAITSPTATMVTLEIDKDLSRATDSDIRAHLPEYL